VGGIKSVRDATVVTTAETNLFTRGLATGGLDSGEVSEWARTREGRGEGTLRAVCFVRAICVG
jgi:hypothetical protein